MSLFLGSRHYSLVLLCGEWWCLIVVEIVERMGVRCKFELVRYCEI